MRPEARQGPGCEGCLHNALRTPIVFRGDEPLKELQSDWLFFFFLLTARGTQHFKFPDWGSNPSPLQWKHSLNPWTTRQIPRLAFYKALVDKQNQGPCADK